tara:strand:- start:174 stop:293 length:120 start_codon:yes stop_codon:yes gene_type:complete
MSDELLNRASKTEHPTVSGHVEAVVSMELLNAKINVYKL